MSKQPVQEIRIGSIHASIWENCNDEGPRRFSVVFTKQYKVVDRWQDTTHFNRDDLLLVSRVADLAYDWILQQKQKLVIPDPMCDL